MSNSRKNVVFILCDQLRPDFLNAYGADFIPTPNIDALAENGVVFDNAITASTVCAPARASIVTGEHVSCHDGWTNGIPCKEGTEYLPERLGKAGYMTAAVGVYDHSPIGNTIGYNYIVPFLEEPKEGYDGYLKYLKSKHPEAKHAWSGKDYVFDYPEEDFYDRFFTDRATDFIDSYVQTGAAPDGTKPQEENAPFFLYCGLNSPHQPHWPPKEVKGTVDINKLPPIVNSTRQDIGDAEKFRRAFLNSYEAVVNPESVTEQRMKDREAYCELIVEVDNLVGRIVDSLKKNGIFEDTTIIFSSDHGSVQNDYNVMTKGPWPYKAQLFVPLIVSNEPSLPKGTHCDCLCGNFDVGATVLDMAGDHKRFGISRSLIGQCLGTVEEREVNFSEFCDSSKTVMDKRYTFIYYPFSNQYYLYDRINDKNEMTNIADDPKYADVKTRFFMHIIDYLLISKGIRIEAHDLVPSVQKGIAKKDPNFLDNFDIAYPMATMFEINRLKEHGLPWDYNEFCRDREIKAHYGVYFMQEDK